MALQQVSSSRCFNGYQRVYQHNSLELSCEMKLGVYLPDVALNATSVELCPVVYFLSGLTCTHENFIQKSGMQRYASEQKLIVVNPDTSPRGSDIPDDSNSWDFGCGAGFYVDATEQPWAKHYRMYSYVTKELPTLVEAMFPIKKNSRGIFGHSMGGHGALICALKNPGFYRSISAFAPICHPIRCAWGQKAFKGYFGDGSDATAASYDACELIPHYNDGPSLHILIDQGTDDEHLSGQLLPDELRNAAEKSQLVKVDLRLQKGFDHGYYFVSSFMGDHFSHHAKALHG